jgi:phage-related protein
MKPLNFVGSSLDDLRNFPDEVRRAAGFEIYVTKLRNVVYVLHAFQKKTRKTSQRDIDLARQRCRQIGGKL